MIVQARARDFNQLRRDGGLLKRDVEFGLRPALIGSGGPPDTGLVLAIVHRAAMRLVWTADLDRVTRAALPHALG